MMSKLSMFSNLIKILLIVENPYTKYVFFPKGKNAYVEFCRTLTNSTIISILQKMFF